MASQSDWIADSPSLILPPGAAPGSPQLVFGPDIPDILVQFYSGFAPGYIFAVELAYLSATIYEYIAYINPVIVNNGVYTGRGVVISGKVYERQLDQSQISVANTALMTSQYGRDTSLAPSTGTNVPDFRIGYQGATRLGEGWVFFSSIPVTINGDLLFGARSAPRSWLDGVNVTTGALTGAVSAETNVSQLQLTANVLAGRTYEILVNLRTSVTVATDTWDLRVRRDTAVTGTQLATYQWSGNATTGQQTGYWIYQSAATETLNIFFSVARTAGTGTITCFGSPGGGIARTMAGIRDIGANGNFRTA